MMSLEEAPLSLAQAPTKRLNMIEAINDALNVMMERDPNVVVFGEDVGLFRRGVPRHGRLAEEIRQDPRFRYADQRMRDHRRGCGDGRLWPASGAGIQFADYIYPGLDQLISEAARLRYRSAGEFTAPITVRSPFGGGIFGGQTHSQSPEALFTHVAGLKTVIPSTPHDAKGLLIAAIEDNDPVIFFEPKRIYNGPFNGYYDKPVEPWAKHEGSVVPEGYYRIPLGKARVVREGEALTVLAYGTMIHVAEAVLAEKGVDAEIIDLRTLVPLDIATVEKSVQKTGKCLIVHEATRTGGFGGELSALVQERCFYHLEAPIERVTGFDTPYPHSLEWAYFPGPVRIGEAVDRLMKA